MSAYADWFNILSWAYLSLCFLCALIVIADEFAHPQRMTVMNFVWPITALYAGPAALWGYFNSGRRMTREHQPPQKHTDELHPGQVAVAATHCGAGCTLGDIGGEWLVAGAALTFAGGVFETRIVVDFLLAWFFGVIFQYFTIAPMRGLGPVEGLTAAIRADTLSIVAFQIGMVAWMALTYYVFFPDPHLRVTEAPFWFMMQIGMIVGFFTSYPANVFLLKRGWKEKMG